MTKPFLYILGILGINLAVSFAAMAFMLSLFIGDPILAAVPAALALPPILLQPWFLAFLFVPGGLYLSPFLTTTITVLVYGSLNRSGMLERPKLALSRFKSRKTFAVVGGFVLLAFAVASARYVDFPSLHQGMPPSVGVLGLNVTDSRYYCLGSFIDSEWLWQARVPESDLTRIASEFDLRNVEGNQIPGAFLRMPPYWWRPQITHRTRVLSTPSFPIDDRGSDGWHALATWNPDDQVLYVWIKNNF
jgi:hypothetical protein